MNTMNMVTFQHFLVSVLFFAAIFDATDADQAIVTCDNELSFYVDGQLEATSTNWEDSSYVTLPANTRILAIKCVNAGGPAGILGEFGPGIYTDSTWKCSTSLESNWDQVNFDDSNWNFAYSIPTSQGPGIWYQRTEDISTSAQWIWTQNWQVGGDNVVYCRKDLEADTVEAKLTCDNELEFYVDGQLMASSTVWEDTSYVAITGNPSVLAIKCTNVGNSPAGIIGEFGPGSVTDSSWKCSNSFESGWNQDNFDDSNWLFAYSIPENEAVSIWQNKVQGISSTASWIWTSNWRNAGSSTLYCRKDKVEDPAQVEVKVTCDNEIDFYVDGQLTISNTEWRDTSYAVIPANANILAIKCKNLGSPGGILGEFGTGVYTDNSWKCSHTFQTGWNQENFDDSSWIYAYEVSDSDAVSIWQNTVQGISPLARWIWTSDAPTWNSGVPDTIYCRRYTNLQPGCPDALPDGCELETYTGSTFPVCSTMNTQGVGTVKIQLRNCQTGPLTRTIIVECCCIPYSGSGNNGHGFTKCHERFPSCGIKPITGKECMGYNI